ncbi:valyl-tRNA synthetase [Balneicella halophila]|uniref:Valine--tRNA ligase n=1 Tax=Balneicella halophila TaxID=1537566 RepID=A0A7L4UQN1_BALHA|nr:valine--tRNA ligase [Balneicella halophila]PVX51979.1 valyl-tRNA synthetase [Balneicella halophila]
MEIPAKYQHTKAENKWYNYWLDNQFFHSTPDEREPYTIVIPPPNVTGVLHMGHMLNNTIQDVLARRARMEGKNVCWVPGTDHASIATEAKVVNKLREEGITKDQLTRESFMEHAWEWKEKHGGIILEQLKKLGASCDWERTRFTMDKELYDSVIKVFIDLYEKGLIYRGVRMVNWDPVAKTAVSDEEVIHKEEQSKLYYLRYQIEGEEDYITIATTRPETILGDTAVCVNPNDERFTKYAGKKCIVPLVNRAVPIIQDEYVDIEFGTGALKITPAHDENDYEIGMRHKLETIDIFNDNGTLSEAAELFVDKDRFEVRDLIIPELEKAGNLVKIEDYTNKVGYSERTDAVIEPKLSAQWFLKMSELAKPALEHVMNDDIKFHPAKFKNVYRHWMENIRDWCISRQLWWGQRIPVYYFDNGEYVVASSIDEALRKAEEKTGKTYTEADLCQDEDVLDTWFSSWLWPISVFNGINKPDNKDINYYYPTNDLITGPDIIFFWVARMIMAGFEYRKEIPFKNVYFTGIVRDSQRRKMSKQLGNSPDPLDLIKEYGADGVRVGILLSAPAGGDLLYEDSLVEQGRNFTTKIWNTFRLVKSWNAEDKSQPKYAATAVAWFEQKLAQEASKLNEQLKSYRISEALMTAYTLIRDDFSSWYLEAVKPPFGEAMDRTTYDASVNFLEQLMQLLHPFMPFVTEEVWQLLREREDGESLMVTTLPNYTNEDASLLEDIQVAQEVVTAIRTIRKDKNIGFKEELTLTVSHEIPCTEVIEKMGNISETTVTGEKPEQSIGFTVNNTSCYIPMTGAIDIEAERKKITEELDYTKGFLNSVTKKLSNERFVNNAPEKVVAIEQKKKADAEAKIAELEAQLKAL